MKHKPECASNRMCAVNHNDGICPDPKKCDCGANNVSQPKTSEENPCGCYEFICEYHTENSQPKSPEERMKYCGYCDSCYRHLDSCPDRPSKPDKKIEEIDLKRFSDEAKKDGNTSIEITGMIIHELWRKQCEIIEAHNKT